MASPDNVPISPDTLRCVKRIQENDLDHAELRKAVRHLERDFTLPACRAQAHWISMAIFQHGAKNLQVTVPIEARSAPGRGRSRAAGSPPRRERHAGTTSTTQYTTQCATL
ncbi:hypothetical protein BCR37DRAFT_381603 [Protomyces lactucae-debilis]|uniref:Uncharacterized protein n=1 Tax=Protomyces lactucae-debilis TaxID=2754530 RepID=A0A1Y2F6G7_PROLT|nr:uncharacterized protein BCR37DRAFT_381603 [Protomyces lactucae-debilis]ORY79439.1 hypothetical protein BCR37DRAFT_381603 [Protomyces lactucae-debilis]